MDRGIRRYHDGGVEFLDDQRPLLRRRSDRAAIDDVDGDRRIAARKGYLALAALRRAGPRRNFQSAEIKPLVAQAATGHAQLHQLDRRLVAVAVGLEIFGDEALADLVEVFTLER